MKGPLGLKQRRNEIKEVVFTVEGGELGRWCELGQNLDSSPLLLLVKDTGVQFYENVVHCDPCDCVLLLI